MYSVGVPNRNIRYREISNVFLQYGQESAKIRVMPSTLMWSDLLTASLSKLQMKNVDTPLSPAIDNTNSMALVLV
jgi:hypothetical protein